LGALVFERGELIGIWTKEHMIPLLERILREIFIDFLLHSISIQNQISLSVWRMVVPMLSV